MIPVSCAGRNLVNEYIEYLSELVMFEATLVRRANHFNELQMIAEFKTMTWQSCVPMNCFAGLDNFLLSLMPTHFYIIVFLTISGFRGI